MPERLISLADTARRALPWAIALVLLALTGLSLTGYELGRPFFLFPALLLLSLCLLPLLARHRPDLPLWLMLAAGWYLASLLASTAFFHVDLLTPTFRNAMVLLILPWSLLGAGLLHPGLLTTARPILAALLAAEVVLVGQIWVSYYTGWGEVIEMGDGIRRAYGAAGDSFNVLLVFIILLNLLRGKAMRVALAFTALCMSAGKLGLLLALFGGLLALPLMKGRQPRLLAVATVIGSLLLGLVMTSDMVRSIGQAKPVATSAPSPASTGQAAPLPAKPLPPARSLPVHLAASSAATGLGRIITIAAGYQIFSEHPLVGAGYGQPNLPEIFQPAVTSDVLGLVSTYGVHPLRLSVERYIGNQATYVAAEQGLMGLIPFLALCLAAVLLSLRVWRHIGHSPDTMDDATALAGAASIWVFCLVVLNQTSAWLFSGSAILVWLAFTLGLCAAYYRLRVSKCPGA